MAESSLNRPSKRKAGPDAAAAGLPDYIESDVQVLFVGINPGLRSAAVGHHFAGYSNRFWKVLYRSGLVPQPLTYSDDRRLPSWGPMESMKRRCRWPLKPSTWPKRIIAMISCLKPVPFFLNSGLPPPRPTNQ